MQRFARRKPANTLCIEDDNFTELTMDVLTIEDDTIKERLKNRAFLRNNRPIYITIEKEFKRGRYAFYLVDNRTGSTVTMKKQVDDQGREITDKPVTFMGNEATVSRNATNFEIVTNAEAIYNMLDNKMLFSLLQIKPQVWQLLVMMIFGAVIGFLIKTMWR